MVVTMARGPGGFDFHAAACAWCPVAQGNVVAGRDAGEEADFHVWRGDKAEDEVIEVLAPEMAFEHKLGGGFARR